MIGSLLRCIVPCILFVIIVGALEAPASVVTFWGRGGIMLAAMLLCGLHAFIVEMTE
jgi:hypothetical protein